MSKSIAIIFSVLTLTVFSFQNCGSQVSFDTASGVLVAKSDNAGMGGDLGAEEEPMPPQDEQNTPYPPRAENEEDCKDKKEGAHRRDPGVNHNQQEDKAEFICILDGPGASVNVGYVDLLQNNYSAPDAVCMTKHACEELVSQKFEVKQAAFRGFCKNADKSGWQVFSDGEISQLLGI